MMSAFGGKADVRVHGRWLLLLVVFDGNHTLAPRCREREPSTPSAFRGKADSLADPSVCPLIAEAVEKVFRGVRGERLVRQQTEQRNNDSNIVPPSFDCCGNTIIELCSPTFSTPSARSGHYKHTEPPLGPGKRKTPREAGSTNCVICR